METTDSTTPALERTLAPKVKQAPKSTDSTILASDEPLSPEVQRSPEDTDTIKSASEKISPSNVEQSPDDTDSTMPASVQSLPPEVERIPEDANPLTPASEDQLPPKDADTTTISTEQAVPPPTLQQTASAALAFELTSHPVVEQSSENIDSITPASEQTIPLKVKRTTEDADTATPSSEQTLPTKVERTPEYIQDEAAFRAASIFKSWDQLQSILDAHQDTIFGRWNKKSRTSKEELLVDAWPEIPRIHRPDFAMFQNFKLLSEVVTDPQELAASKWPHINLEDLCKGKHLLMLIETRARNHPIVFARSDLEASLVSRAMSMFSVADCSGHSISLSGDTAGNYATVIPLVGNEYAQNRLKYGADYGVPEGLVILEIQQKLLQFLQTCCEGILHDKRIPNPLESWTSLYELNKTAPYCPPVAPDFQQLISLLVAHLTLTTDHLWDLRTDPGYFLDAVTARLDSTTESVGDADGNPDPGYKTQDLWDKCATVVIEDAYTSVIVADIWFAVAANMHARFGNLLQDGQLPSESPDHRDLLEQILCLRYMMDVQSDFTCQRLANCVSTESSFCEYFMKRCNGGELEWLRPKGEINDRLFFLFSPIGYLDVELESQMGNTNLLNEIENVLESAPNEKKRLSANSLMVLGRVGCFLSAAKIMDHILPSVSAVYLKMLADDFEETDHRLNRFRIETLVELHITNEKKFKDGMHKMSSVGFGPPKSGKFDYPCWKTRTPETLMQMHRAEQFLDECWKKFDRSFYKACGRSIHDNDPEIFKYRQRPWTEEPNQKHLYKDSGVELDEIDIALALLDLKVGNDGSTAKVDLETSDTMTMQELLAVKPSDFVFTERSLKVFRKMFSTPSAKPPGDIKWKDFLQAMLDAGFEITKQYGSLWLFTPLSLGPHRSIFLHEPPLGEDTKSVVLQMGFKTAQRLAKRLNCAYGWDETWFVSK